MAGNEAALEDFLKTAGALYDETRVKILKLLLLHGPLCICDLEASTGMIQSRLSRHMKILKEAGFVTARREGRWVYYAIRSPMDRFRAAALEEIGTLPLDLPPLKRQSGVCKR
ncbi:metalloregulator ArsR/SmtB family transcription factor [Hydrogenimonas sp. SS33]|uniref:ArsR/SmtB family transcription factor n=1 Tax=Hydrogenimonas leucolamina TaxID=2954236 RepID=UPI00336C1BF1